MTTVMREGLQCSRVIYENIRTILVYIILQLRGKGANVICEF